MIEISPNALYSAHEIEALLGRRGLERLRSQGGLRAVGDRYLGRQIISAFLIAAKAQNKDGMERAEKEVSPPAEVADSLTAKVPPRRGRPRQKLATGQTASLSLKEQLAEVQSKFEEKARGR